MDLMLLAGWYHAISFTARALRLHPSSPAPRGSRLRALL